MKRRDFAIGLASGGLAALAVAPRAGRAENAPLKMVAPPDWAQSPATTLGRSDALLIAQDGRLVFERYGPEHGPEVRHISWSMAKSVTHALTGIAVNEGMVDVDAPLKTVAHPDPKLSLRALLTLTDGLDWDEGSYKPTDSDAARMLYGAGRLDGAAFTAAKRQAHGNIKSRQFQAFLDANLVVILVEHTKVKHQQGRDDAHEHQPHPQRRAGKQQIQPFHFLVFLQSPVP